MQVIFNKEETRLPIFSWATEIQESAKEQVKNLASLPFAFHHLAVMPDVHKGYGMIIGGVMATKGVIVPNAVGKDIGCGMCAVKTTLTDISHDDLKKIMGEIRKVVPVGRNHHKESQPNDFVTPGEVGIIFSQEEASLDKQIGTLGSGNHFIEIQKGNDGFIWIMVHSGSRNLGSKIADYYNKLAIELNEKYHSTVTTDKELAFLPVDSEEGKAYILEMETAVEFAFANRKLMVTNILKSMHAVLGQAAFGVDDMINIAHNYARLENHYGENVWVHRKGATSAREGEIGIIPGSQGSKSYIVRGKGNKESFQSCSHGAGRKLGRKQAERELDLAGEIKKLDDQGIIHAVRSKKELEEAPGAYKDIDEVMENQKDPVEILVELKPLAVIKG